MRSAPKPRVMLLADAPHLDAGRRARSLAAALDTTFDFGLAFASDRPPIDPADWDILYVFGLKQRWHRRFGFEPGRVIKEVLGADLAVIDSERLEQHLKYESAEEHTLVATSRHAHRLIRAFIPRSKRYDIVLDPDCRPAPARARDLQFGELGHDPSPLLSGRLPCAFEDDWWNADVLVAWPGAEDERLSVLGAMARGAFVISVGVPEISELIVNGVTGLSIRNDVDDLRAAIAWAQADPAGVRLGGARSAAMIEVRHDPQETSAQFGSILWGEFSRLGSSLRPRRDLRQELSGVEAGWRDLAVAQSRVILQRLRGRLPADRSRAILALGCGGAELMSLRRMGYRKIETFIAPGDRAGRLEIGHLADRIWDKVDAIIPGRFAAVVAGGPDGRELSTRVGVPDPVCLA